MTAVTSTEFGRWTRPNNGAEVVFNDVYAEERDLELKHGVAELLQRFQGHCISRVLDPQRQNVGVILPRSM